MDEQSCCLAVILDEFLNDKDIGTEHSINEINYHTFDFLQSGLQTRGIPVQENLPKLLEAIDPNVKLPNKISNLTRKVKKISSRGE